MITKSTVEKYKIWFDYYINQFLIKYPELSENIQIKADHCKKVSEEIVSIAKSLQLNENEILLAQTIGLFHDLGRFRQYVKYRTFSDSKSQNHAELAIDVLKENRILSDLIIENQEIIYKAIINHSRAEIIPDHSEKVIFFSKLIRDADKLDIWRLITAYYMVKEEKGDNKTLELELPDNNKISDEVFHSIMNKQVVLKESMKTLNDFKLLQIGWVFDLNFSYSIQRLFEKKYLEKIFDTLPKNKQVSQIKGVVDAYFEKHIETYTYK
jgi:hypothetical protein